MDGTGPFAQTAEVPSQNVLGSSPAEYYWNFKKFGGDLRGMIGRAALLSCDFMSEPSPETPRKIPSHPVNC